MITFAEFSVNQILPLIDLLSSDRSKILLSDFEVKNATLRLKCFKKNLTCVKCG